MPEAKKPQETSVDAQQNNVINEAPAIQEKIQLRALTTVYLSDQHIYPPGEIFEADLKNAERCIDMKAAEEYHASKLRKRKKS
ncbi:hypothetical protein [Piscirickettsia litoralis]|uniref:Uncharacterized protein n=1 Tax=Piscirickettsia litoralis TaxID=1891921 RepID=A0ABX2ZY88_9GAMM|nr:hypothetical protein [Piscirickettsia litoralis]ODN41561.1 hypothetical protein BGC07_15750 [Piscirickettsia litoralis]